VDVTVIIPTIGRESLVEATASVHAQTVPCELLIGHDGTGRGPARVRNSLLAVVTTPWVVFLDDDDLLDPEFVRTLLDHSGDADVVIPWCRFSGRTIPRKYHNPLGFDREQLRRHGCWPVTVLARTQTVLDVGGFPKDARYEDWEMFNRLADNGARFTVVPRELWTYRLDGGGHRTDAA
jgi:glycosyltransferase involved in cell wall biosynthesis